MEEEKTKLTTKELLKVMLWTFKLYFKMSPSKTIILILTSIIGRLRSLMYSALMAKVIDELVRVSLTENKDIKELYTYIMILLLYYIFVEGLIDNLYNYSSRGLRLIDRSELERLMYRKLHSLGIQNLEDPETVNLIQRCQTWIYDTFSLLNDFVIFLSNIINTAIAGAVIISFFPLMIPVLLVLTIIKFIPSSHFMKKDFHWQIDNTEGKRKASYSSYNLTNAASMQEISIVGAFNYFDKKYSDFYNWFNAGILKINKDREFANFFLNIIDSITSLAGYVIIFSNFLIGKITIGTVSFQMRALDTFSNSAQEILSSILYMNEYAIKMNDLVTLFEMKPRFEDGAIKLPRLTEPPQIEFINVSFKYPNSDKFIFKNLDLKIASGEKVALVGHNGAGKTTIVKLLSRIYKVTDGEIRINGININDLSIDDYYKNLGVLFQDFNFYPHLTVKENIYAGKTAKEIDEKDIITASKNADAHDFVQEYENKYDQIMTEKLKGGIRPSSGQQQKIAISRFFYRNAPLAVFDEPTAAIDAVSEYKIFNKIYGFFTKKTVIIISHRFSTVRNADRIIVLEKGKIVEEGTHRELVQKEDGKYKSAYDLQAEGYQS